MQELENIVTDAEHAFQAVKTLPELDQVKARFLGKQGVLSELRKGLAKVSAEERPILGAKFNTLKTELESLPVSSISSQSSVRMALSLTP